ncbi:MAG: universal stress protein [Ilumatobacteraceae bacterium]|nr:universal stress protein [Ilumatobacteraceae bacterium]
MSDPRTVVVGVDASQESQQALTWARSIAGPDDRIVVVHAWEIPLMTGYDMVLAVDIDEIEQLSKQGLDELVVKLDDPRLVGVARRGHAGRALVDEGEDADLIVVGHRGNSRLSLMLGSTANYVLHHTEQPVVVVRGDEPTAPPRRVVVGVDDFDDPEDSPSVRALQWAANLPGVEEVRAVHAWYLPPLAVGMYHPASADLTAMDEAAQRVADRVVAAVGPIPDGVTITADVARGTGGFAMIEASRDTDLVVVGRRGRGGFSELLLGSTSAETAAHSHAPVAVIR